MLAEAQSLLRAALGELPVPRARTERREVACDDLSAACLDDVADCCDLQTGDPA